MPSDPQLIRTGAQAPVLPEPSDAQPYSAPPLVPLDPSGGNSPLSSTTERPDAKSSDGKTQVQVGPIQDFVEIEDTRRGTRTNV